MFTALSDGLITGVWDAVVRGCLRASDFAHFTPPHPQCPPVQLRAPI